MNKSVKRKKLDEQAQSMDVQITEVKGYFIKDSRAKRFEEGIFCQTLDDVDLYFRCLESGFLS
jgi:hypothetical protein